MEPKQVNGWNVAELAGGLILSADNFTAEFTVHEVDKLITILNTDQEGAIRDNEGNVVKVKPLNDTEIVLTRVNDKVYPHGIILPIDAFTEEENEPIIEAVRPAFRRVGSKIKRAFRVTAGRRKGRIVTSPAGANKPPASATTRNKLRIAAKRNKLIRALKSKLTRKKSASIKLRRLNKS